MEAILFLLQTVRYTILVLRDRTCVTNYVLRKWRAQGFDLVVRTLRERKGGVDHSLYILVLKRKSKKIFLLRGGVTLVQGRFLLEG